MSQLEHNSTDSLGFYITSLSFQGAKCFKQRVSVDFLASDGNYSPWTLIIGPNGVGKTTLLRILSALTSSIRVRPSRTEDSISFIDFLSIQLENLHLDDYMSIPLEEVSKRLHFSGLYIGSNTLITCHFRSFANESFSHFWPYIEETIPKNYDLTSLNLRPIVLGYGATRHMSLRGLSEDILANASKSLFDDTATLTNTEELYLQTLLRYKNGGTERDKLLLDKVEWIITRVLPDLKDHPAEQKIRAVDAPSGFGTRMEVNTPYGWVPIPELSLGYKTMIAWIVDFASKLFALYPDSPDPLAEPAICLVDEIDLHMHPRWQRDIMDFLLETFPKTQFIVTAHSPLIVQASAKANIVLLKQVGDHVEVENDPEIVEDWRIDQLLTSDLFGLDSARSKSTANEMAEQDKLLAMPVRSPEEEERLQVLNERLKSLPLYDSPTEKKAQSVLDKMIEILQRKPEA